MQNTTALYDQNLAARLKDGDEHAFNEIYNRYYTGIIFFARRFVAVEEAQDITADTFIKLWNHRSDFNALPEIQHWLRVSAQHACIDALRKAKTASEASRRLMQLSDTAYEDIYFRDMLSAGLYKRIDDAIETLPPQAKIIFRLAFIKGLKNEAIATQLDISEKTVRNQKTIALSILRKVLSHEDFLLIRILPVIYFFKNS